MTVVTAHPLSARLMLLSIRPRHVANILSGHKTIELRRSRPAIAPGQPVAIYSTTPDTAIVALCTVAHVEVGAPNDLWQVVQTRAGLERAEFDHYFRGASTATAIHLSDVVRLDAPVSLGHLRLNSRYQPPQTWHFLTESQIARLLGDHPARVEIDSWRTSGSPEG